MVARQREEQEAKLRTKGSMIGSTSSSRSPRPSQHGSRNSARSDDRDSAAKNAARVPRSDASVARPGAESVTMDSPRTPSSRNRPSSKAGYVPSHPDDDGERECLKPPPVAKGLPLTPTGSGDYGRNQALAASRRGQTMLPENKDPDEELEAILVEEEGEDEKLKRLEEMENRLKQQMQDLHQSQIESRAQDPNNIMAEVGNIDLGVASADDADDAPSKKRGMVIVLVVLIVAIAGGLAGYFLSQGGSNDDNASRGAIMPPEAPTVGGGPSSPSEPTVPTDATNPTAPPVVELVYDPPSRAECRVMEVGEVQSLCDCRVLLFWRM